MVSEVKFHNFELDLTSAGVGSKIKMNGQRLDVSSLCVKAGTNGYTNIAIEIPACAAVQAVAALNATISEEYDLREHLYHSLEQAIYETSSDCIDNPVNKWVGLETDRDFGGSVVKRLLELLLENS